MTIHHLRFTIYLTILLLTAFCLLCLLPISAAAQGTNYPTSLDNGISAPVPVDNKTASLTVALSSSATTATVVATGGFPAAGVFTIESEQVAYTGKTGTTFTGLTRGFAGTTARPHSINMTIRMPIVAAHITGARGAALELEKKVGIGASNAADADTDDVLTKNADGSTSWKPAVTSGSIADPGGSNDDVLQRKAGAWTNRTIAQLKADLNLSGSNSGDQDLSGLVPNTRTVNGHALSANVTVTPTDLGLVIGTDVESHDADLTAIAGLSASNDDILQRKTGAWTNRTPAQVKTDLVLVKGDVGLENVANVDTTNAANISSGSLNSARLPTSAVSPGTYGSATQVGQFTVSSKGIITGASLVTITPDWSSLTGLPTTLSGYGITDAQPLDDELTALAGLTSAANKLPYFTGSGTAAVADFTTAGRALVDDADASAQRTTLGLAIGADVQAFDSDLTTIAGLTATTDNFIVSVASAWASRTPAQVKTTLSLNNVENTALSTWAGTSNITTLGTIGTGTWQGGVINSTYGGMGVNNAGRTLAVNTNSGTISFGAASKNLTVNNSIGISGTDGSTLNVGAGGTLGTAAFQNTGTSGANLPFLNGTNAWSGVNTFGAGSGAPVIINGGSAQNVLVFQQGGTDIGAFSTQGGLLTVNGRAAGWYDGGSLASPGNLKLWANPSSGWMLSSANIVGFYSAGISGSPDSALGRKGIAALEITNGSASGLGFLYYGRPVTAKTSNYTVVSADKNTFFTNTGAAGTVNFTLPTAAAGLTYEFYVDAAQTVTVTAGASTTIRVGASVSTSAGNITSNTQGNKVRLVAISTTQWVGETVGTWTFN